MLNLARLYHTVRYLRPAQIVGRAWFRLYVPKPELLPAPDVRTMAGTWNPAARRRQSILKPRVFRFLNKVRDFGSAILWDDSSLERLWIYNLHYFDDLNAQGAESRTEWHRALLIHWVQENPPGRGTGWEPYPTSLRIVNWIKWALAGNALPPECLHSMAVQVRWLSRRLEYHLFGNHLFANAKALVFAGMFFQGPEAERWLEAGLRILAREVPEQILQDGGQFERSTMYHALALEDMLDLCNVTAAFPGAISERRKVLVEGWPEVVRRMRHWLGVMCHPDGEIAFFNDAAFGIAPPPEELHAYARRIAFPPIEPIPDGVTRLASSGYVRVQCGPLVALLDVAPVGPDYLPGHAHADTLSFELSLFGQRLLINSGTSQYGVGIERLRQRGTAAHNTVTVAGLDSSEVWSGFRVARRARPFDLQITERDGAIVVSCSHDGFQRLPGRPMHHREWRLSSNGLRVTDRINVPCTRSIARFYLHPNVEIVAEQALRLPDGKCLQWSVDGGAPRVAHSSWHPEFGASIPNRCIEIQFEGPEISIDLRW